MQRAIPQKKLDGGRIFPHERMAAPAPAYRMPARRTRLALRRVDTSSATSPRYNSTLSGTPRSAGDPARRSNPPPKRKTRGRRRSSASGGPAAQPVQVLELSERHVHYTRSGSLVPALEQDQVRVWTIGTALSNDLILHSEAVDPRHARWCGGGGGGGGGWSTPPPHPPTTPHPPPPPSLRVVEGGAVLIQDLNSTFGVFINDQRVRGTAQCVVGDEIRFGIAPFGLCFRLELSGDDVEAALSRFAPAPATDPDAAADPSADPATRSRWSLGNSTATAANPGPAASFRRSSVFATPHTRGAAFPSQPASLRRFADDPEVGQTSRLLGPAAKIAHKRRARQVRGKSNLGGGWSGGGLVVQPHHLNGLAHSPVLTCLVR